MTKTFSIKTLAATAIVCVGAATAADAATIIVSQQGGNVFQDSNNQNAWQVGQNVTYRNEADTGFETDTFGAGLFRLTADATIDFWAFCVDLFDSLDLDPPAAFHRDDFLFAGTTRQRIDALASNALGLVTNSRTASAFQLSLWEIITDATLNLGEGNFVSNVANTDDDTFNTRANNARSDAAQWLKNITDGVWTAKGTEFTFLQSDTNQDLLAFGLGAPTPVPLPAAGWMLLAGIGALVAAKRRSA